MALGYSISAEVVGAKELEEAFKKAPEVTKTELSHAIKDIMDDLANRASRLAPHLYGILQASIAAGKEGPFATSDNVYGKVGTNVNYAAHVEYGTKPHFPPRAPMMAWAKKQLGNEKLWFPIARAIARRGTKGKFMYKQALEEVTPKFTQAIGDAVGRIVSFLARG